MKKCFVISPIGQEGSDIRKKADDLFDLIIEPAMEKYDFNVVRGDMVTTTTPITDDVIKRIQESELCIIDLTGHNPNVFYECGRRHETNKPFILIKEKGEVIPFDLKDIRTVDYDLSDPRKARASIENLRKFVDELESLGYHANSTASSIESIFQSLKRIERKIETTMINNSTNLNQAATNTPLSGNPYQIFLDALHLKDFTTCVSALNKYMKINDDVNIHLLMADSLVLEYEPAGAIIARNIIDNNFDYLDTNSLKVTLFDLYKFYLAAGKLNEEYNYLQNITKKALDKPGLNNDDQASFYNILASLESGIKNDIQAVKFQEKTLELVPGEPAYYYNTATIYQALKNKEKMLENIEWLLTIAKTSEPNEQKVAISHLEYAKRMFKENGLQDKANELDIIIANAKAGK